MPLSSSAHFTYAVDPDARLAVARMSGILTGADMVHIAATVHGDPAWQPSFNAIWDCSAVQAHAVQPFEMEPLLNEMVEVEAGRDILLEGPGLTAELFSKLLVLRLRRRGDAAETVYAIEEALRALGLDAMPRDLAGVLSA